MSDSVYGLENIIRDLRAENKCLRLNLATDSREADALREEVDRLRPEVERLTAERDQAREEQISAVNAMLKAEQETARLTTLLANEVHGFTTAENERLRAENEQLRISRDEWRRMYDEARPVEQSNPLAYVPITGPGVDAHERRKERGTLEDHEPRAAEQKEPTK